MKIKRVSDTVARAFRLRILHISDTHGGFPKMMGSYDVVVHSGDFFPDFFTLSGNKTQMMACQLDWLTQNIRNIKIWLQDTPLLFILGNHDWLHPELMEQTLCSGGIKAISLHDKIVTHQGVNFYGFPYVPSINGEFNYEREVPEMTVEVDKMVQKLQSTYVDVIVAHAPLYRVLDLTHGNTAIGSSVISTALDYKLNKDMTPATYLCGHCHEANGITVRNGMLISNAARTYHVIEV
jgi:Icc-related predicted phosphoesterase